MSVEVTEEMVDVLGGDRVSVPLFDVKGEQCLVLVGV
jgi:hypothetical protein